MNYAIVFSILALAVLLVGCAPEEQVTNALGPGTYRCSVTNVTMNFSRVSDSLLRGYPYVENNSGYRDCRSGLTTGQWTVVPQIEVFSKDSCFTMDNATFCFKSTNPVEDAQIRAMIADV